MSSRKVWFLKLTDDQGTSGIGEVAPIDRLSPEELDDIPEYLEKLKIKLLEEELPTSEEEALLLVTRQVSEAFPSVRFGIEMALLDVMNGGQKHIFTSNLHQIRIPINGLVWMGDMDFMQDQIRKKLDEGFSCIKLKVGALDFDSELNMIKSLRELSDDLVIRLDANGAFQTNEVLFKLKELSKYNIHSIEQPIMPMQPEAMELICSRSEVPIALDEELIGVNSSRDRVDLLQDLKPQYLVLKPTLHGGFSSVAEWIDLAEMHGINWWVTSYLESNIGLNAIAQFASKYSANDEFHGLGTGGLYHNNITSPIQIDHGYFQYAKSNVWGDVGI